MSKQGLLRSKYQALKYKIFRITINLSFDIWGKQTKMSVYNNLQQDLPIKDFNYNLLYYIFMPLSSLPICQYNPKFHLLR